MKKGVQSILTIILIGAFSVMTVSCQNGTRLVHPPQETPRIGKPPEEVASPVESAGDVVLELQTWSINSEKSLLVFNREDLRYENVPEPEGVTAPEGNLQWGRLTLGEHSYLLCMEKKDDKFTKLYLDINGDRNLATEAPKVSERESGGAGFWVEGIPAAFKFRDTLVLLEMTVAIAPMVRDVLIVSTAYVGTTKTELGEFEIIWIPGEKPRIRRPSKRGDFNVLVAGRRMLSLHQKDVVLEDGRAVISCNITTDCLVPVEAPNGLTGLELWQDPAIITYCEPGDDGRFFVPEGNHDLISGHLRRTAGDVEYVLSFNLPEISVPATGTLKIDNLEPLIFQLNVTQEDGIVSIRTRSRDAAGRTAWIFKYAPELTAPLPGLIVRDSEGRELANHQYESG